MESLQCCEHQVITRWCEKTDYLESRLGCRRGRSDPTVRLDDQSQASTMGHWRRGTNVTLVGTALTEVLRGPTPAFFRRRFPSDTHAPAFCMQMRPLVLPSVCMCRYWPPPREFSLILSFESTHLAEAFSDSIQGTILPWWHVSGFVIICLCVCLPSPKNSPEGSCLIHLYNPSS